ncbi:hypothetical protein TKK_0013630 [Trichogramma kaykai]
MHRKFRRKLRLPNDIAVVVRLVLLLLFVIVETPWYLAKYPCSVAMTTDKLQECRDIPCKVGEQCLVRKFWCSNPPCPTMVYCSKSRTESLKGPESCQSVVCPKGYQCLTQVNECNWDKKCKHRITRCVTAQVYQNQPTNCDDVTCPSGHRCILREMNCYRPPCRLTKNCARNADASAWIEQCKQIGCRSEYDCFLRKPQKNCTKPLCNHTPDCLNEVENYETMKDERSCRGWICPRGQECFIRHLNADCHEDCISTKECRDLPPKIPRGFFEPTDIILSDPVFAEFEEEDFLEEHGKSEDHFPDESTISSTKSQDFFVSLSNNPRDYDDSNEQPISKAKRLSPTSTPSQLDTSLADSQWQSYLKKKAGSEAVQYWVSQSRNKEKYGEFAEWLDSVADLLDRVSYAKWLYEVRRSSANVPEFQAWLQQYHRSCQSDINTASDPDTFGYQARIGLSHRDRTLAQKAGRVVGVAGDGGARLDPSTRVPAGYILASRMQNPPSPDFKFNEAATPAAPVVAAIPSHLNTATTLAYQHAAITPSIALPLPLHYLALPQQTVHHNSADVRQVPREPDANEALRNSLNALQSYYRLNSPNPQSRYYLPSFFPDASSTQQPVKPLVPNFSRVQNFSVTSSTTTVNLNEWLPRIAQDLQPIKIINMAVDEDGISAGRNSFNMKEKLPEHWEADTQLVKKMIDQLSSTGRNITTPFIFNLMNSTNYQDKNNSHLLIYFPSPLNILICVTYQEDVIEKNRPKKIHDHNFFDPLDIDNDTIHKDREDELNMPSTPAYMARFLPNEKQDSLNEHEMGDKESIILLKMKPHLSGAVAAGMKYLLDSIKAPNTEAVYQFQSSDKVDSLLKEIGKAIHKAIAEIVNAKRNQNPVQDFSNLSANSSTRSMRKEICDEKCKENALKELNNPSMKEFLQWLMKKGLDSNPFFENPKSQTTIATESVKQTGEINNNPSIRPSFDDMREKGINVLQCLPKTYSIQPEKLHERPIDILHERYNPNEELNKKEKNIMNTNCTKLSPEDLSKIKEFLHWLNDRGFNASTIEKEVSNEEGNDPSSFDRTFEDQSSNDPRSNVDNSDGRRSKSFDNNEPPPTDDDTKEIRIKVDMDKSPESIRSLFANNLKPNNRNEPSDNHEIQLTINLKSDTDDTNEAKMSRKVIDMAIKLSNANKTSSDDQQLPKVLWVFPSYEDPPNQDSPAKRMNLGETQKKAQDSESQTKNGKGEKNNEKKADEYDENYDEGESYDQGGDSGEYDDDDDS